MTGRGMADIILSYFGVSYERHQFIDFSHAIDFATTYIVSKASHGVSGEILGGVFDGLSYFLSFLVLACLTLIVIASNLLLKNQLNPRALGNHLSNICLRCFSHVVAQGFPNRFSVNGYSGQMAWTILILFCLIFQLMHSSIFISKLMAKDRFNYQVHWQKIDNLHDLETRPDLKILLREDSYVDHALNQLHNWDVFQSRIEYFGEYDVDYAELLTKVKDGTHVMIEDEGNFQEFMMEANANESCTFHPSQFLYSAERIFSLPSTFPMRKGLVHAEEINLRLMWIDAYGLAGQYDSNVNVLSNGIFSPIKMDKDCKLNLDMVLGPDKFCYEGENTPLNEPLGWKHFRITFIYLLAGLSLACAVFMLELLHVKNAPEKIKVWM
eukprot:TCALIF_08728-PA protein Name:"Protein of unknown function" AED:0.90 eAED:0.90 QI:0/0/0/0.33/0/0.33/3/0/381